MITLCCTKKLLLHLTARPDPAPHDATSALGDWYGNLVFVPGGPPLIHLGKTRDRRVLGTMNDAAWMLECGLRDHPRRTSLEEIEDRLAEVPYSLINFRYPRDVARELLGAPAQVRPALGAPVKPQSPHGASKKSSSGTPALLKRDPEPVPTRASQERSMLVVDVRHWLTDDGDLPTDNPRLRRNALRVARFIEYGGPLEVGHRRETLVEWSKRAGGQPCLGLMWVVKTEEQAIHAYCPVCRQDATAHGPQAPHQQSPQILKTLRELALIAMTRMSRSSIVAGTRWCGSPLIPGDRARHAP